METNKGYLFNSKNWDIKGRRVSVIGQEIEGKLRIWELTCSKSDSYKKLTAKVVYDMWCMDNKGSSKFHPKIHFIDIKEGDSAKYTFEQYCSNNFYKLIPCQITIQDNRLYKNGSFIKVSHSSPKVVKIKTL